MKSEGGWIWMTRREAAAVAFIVDAALEDEEPSEIRAALIRARDKLRKVSRTRGEDIAARKDAATMLEP